MVAVPLATAGRPALKVRHAGYTVAYVRMLPDDGSMTAAGFSKVLSGPVCTGRGLHAFHAACSGMPASDADRHPQAFFFTESGQRAPSLPVLPAAQCRAGMIRLQIFIRFRLVFIPDS